MLDAFLTIIPEAKTGKILVQRNEKTLTHKLLYTKLPGIASTSTVILLDPMLATGGSVILAIKEILEHTEVFCNYSTRLIYFDYYFYDVACCLHRCCGHSFLRLPTLLFLKF